MRPLRTAISQRGPNNDPSQSRARRSTKRVPAPFTTASTQYRAGCCSASRSQASSCSWGSVWRCCRARRFFMGYFSCCSFPTRYTCAGVCASSAIARREFAPRASSLSRSNCNARTAPLSGNIVRCVAPRWNYATRIDMRREGNAAQGYRARHRLRRCAFSARSPRCRHPDRCRLRGRAARRRVVRQGPPRRRQCDVFAPPSHPAFAVCGAHSAHHAARHRLRRLQRRRHTWPARSIGHPGGGGRTQTTRSRTDQKGLAHARAGRETQVAIDRKGRPHGTRRRRIRAARGHRSRDATARDRPSRPPRSHARAAPHRPLDRERHRRRVESTRLIEAHARVPARSGRSPFEMHEVVITLIANPLRHWRARHLRRCHNSLSSNTSSVRRSAVNRARPRSPTSSLPRPSMTRRRFIVVVIPAPVSHDLLLNTQLDESPRRKVPGPRGGRPVTPAPRCRSYSLVFARIKRAQYSNIEFACAERPHSRTNKLPLRRSQIIPESNVRYAAAPRPAGRSCPHAAASAHLADDAPSSPWCDRDIFRPRRPPLPPACRAAWRWLDNVLPVSVCPPRPPTRICKRGSAQRRPTHTFSFVTPIRSNQRPSSRLGDMNSECTLAGHEVSIIVSPGAPVPLRGSRPTMLPNRTPISLPQQAHERLLRDGGGIQKCFGVVTAERGQQLVLLFRFHPLGDGLEIELMRHDDDGLDQGLVAFVFGEESHKGPVGLEVVYIELLEIGQRREAGAEIVYRHLDAAVPELEQTLLHLG